MSLKRYRSGTEIPGDLGDCLTKGSGLGPKSQETVSHKRYWSGTKIPGHCVSQEVLVWDQNPRRLCLTRGTALGPTSQEIQEMHLSPKRC